MGGLSASRTGRHGGSRVRVGVDLSFHQVMLSEGLVDLGWAMVTTEGHSSHHQDVSGVVLRAV